MFKPVGKNNIKYQKWLSYGLYIFPGQGEADRKISYPKKRSSKAFELDLLSTGHLSTFTFSTQEASRMVQ